MNSNVESSIQSLFTTFTQIGNLEFRLRNAVSSAALASNEDFEAHCIRDGDEAELSLFEPSEGRSYRDGEEVGWASGPAIVKPQPISVDHPQPDRRTKKQMQSNHTGDVAVTRSYLMAIKKLLDVYPQPRLAEHVQALSRQLETLEGSIAELQAELQSGTSRSLSRPPKKKKAVSTSKTRNRQVMDEIQDAIQREQLEILALTDLRDERRAELRKLSEEIVQANTKPASHPSPKKLKTKKTPSKPKSIMSDLNDPFVLSRAESLRRSIQRVKSPHPRNKLPSSGLRPIQMDQDEDTNLPNTPTPKSNAQKQLERNLTQLRSHAHPRVEEAQLSVSPLRTTVEEPPPEYPLASMVPQNEPRSSPAPVIEEACLPESRLAAVKRLNRAFWKSATMASAIVEGSSELQDRCQRDGEVTYQETISALLCLIESYPTPSLTPTQLIEAVLYNELLRSLSSLDSTDTLEAVSYEQDWCVPLEPVKAKLLNACQRFGVDTGLNRTAIYFLVGKAVLRIERRVSPIAVCVC